MSSAGRKGKDKAKAKAKAKPVTVEGLIEQGNVAAASMQPELAMRFFQRALTMEPEDTNIMDALADVCLQLGDHSQAFQLLDTSTTIAPEENPLKWCFYAQLQNGLDSVGSYERCIQILKDKLDSAEAEGGLQLTYNKQICRAYCGIAELYMTDLCYEDAAEASCERAIEDAMMVDGDSLDAKQALASFRLSQNRAADAAVIMKEVYSRVITIRKAVRARTVIDEVVGAEASAEVQDPPEVDFCISTAKYMIECASMDRQLAEDAMTLLVDLLDDDDENVELWYIMGVAALSLDPPDVGAARHHLEQAKSFMDLAREEMDLAGAAPDAAYFEQYDLVTEKLRIVEDVEQKMGINATGENHHSHRQEAAAGATNGEDMEEEWSTCGEEEDEDEEDSTMDHT